MRAATVSDDVHALRVIWQRGERCRSLPTDNKIEEEQ